jgi:hypothetical protein
MGLRLIVPLIHCPPTDMVWAIMERFKNAKERSRYNFFMGVKFSTIL